MATDSSLQAGEPDNKSAESYPFEWVDHAGTAADYGAMLVRISREYDRRF
jgi:hypothetical protein